MSKQKEVEMPETENEVTENLVEQTELEGISEIAETPKEEPEIEKPAKVGKSTKKSPETSSQATKAKKMGVYKFLMLYPQDIYISTLLKQLYPNSFFTKDEWFQRIQEIMNTPINH
ncbi:MAG: hypothetical protein J6T31_05310 [Methanobrevibacter sp.]|nr:hypothetical protein [Methanobrevibacter sp.]